MPIDNSKIQPVHINEIEDDYDNISVQELAVFAAQICRELVAGSAANIELEKRE